MNKVMGQLPTRDELMQRLNLINNLFLDEVKSLVKKEDMEKDIKRLAN